MPLLTGGSSVKVGFGVCGDSLYERHTGERRFRSCKDRRKQRFLLPVKFSLNFCALACGSCQVYFTTLRKAEKDTNTIPESVNLVMCFVLTNVLHKSANFENKPKHHC